MRSPKAAIILLCCLSLAGCATWALDMAPERPDRPWKPVTTPDGEIVAGERGASSETDTYVLPSNPALAVVPPPPTVNSAKVYTLADLIDLAESNNPATRVAWNDARKVALAAGIAESAYLPTITASALAGYQGSHGSSSALGVGFSNGASLTGALSAISMQWLLFDFGERVAVIDAAKQLSVISNVAFTAAHQQVIYSVSLAFYANSAAQARLATAAQSLKNAQAVQAAAEDRYKHGIGTVTEVAQARQGTAQANLQVVHATGGAQDAYLVLISAIGISPLTKIKIADVSGRKLSPSMEAPVDKIIAEALARRPDMQGAYAAEKASLAKVYAAQAEFMPKVFVAATGAYNGGSLDVTAVPSTGQQPPTLNVTGGTRLSGSLFAGVAVPVYDGGTRAAILKQTQADADSAQARLDRIRDDAVHEIAAADNGLRTSLAAYSAAQALATAAQTTFDAALAAYRNGVGSITDLTLAQSQLLQAKNAASDAHSAALSAAVTLALATGALGQAPR
jgi:outer membrane protein TolC